MDSYWRSNSERGEEGWWKRRWKPLRIQCTWYGMVARTAWSICYPWTSLEPSITSPNTGDCRTWGKEGYWTITFNRDRASWPIYGYSSRWERGLAQWKRSRRESCRVYQSRECVFFSNAVLIRKYAKLALLILVRDFVDEIHLLAFRGNIRKGCQVMKQTSKICARPRSMSCSTSQKVLKVQL